MSMISVRVDKELKKRMEKMKDVNWSEVVRQALTRFLAEEEAQNLAKALLLNERNLVVPDEGYSSLQIIKEGRGKIRWKS
jgi:Arc/MetJ-type ribon-helix-helix transcriptional regulator